MRRRHRVEDKAAVPMERRPSAMLVSEAALRAPVAVAPSLKERRGAQSAPEAIRPQNGRNNRLAPGIRGSRRPGCVRWRAFDQLPEPVADVIRDSRSMLCPVAALRLVNRSNRSSEEIAHFLEQRAAWTDWRVLAADFGNACATLLRPDAPRRKPTLGRRPNG